MNPCVLLIFYAAISLFHLSSLAFAASATAPQPSASLFGLQAKLKDQAYQGARELSEHYLAALLNLENEAAAQADYETALEAQRIKEELIQSYNQNPYGPPLSWTRVISASEAKLYGSVTLDRQHGTLHDWKSSASHATWDLLRIEPGTYQVTLVYTYEGASQGLTTPPSSLKVEVGESSALAQTNAAPLQGIILLSQVEGQYMTATIGSLPLPRNSARLYFKMTDSHGQYLVLRELRLTPNLHLTRLPTPNAPLAPVSEFDWTLESHAIRLLELMRPPIQEYKALIEAYLQEHASSNNPSLVQQLKQELKISEEFLAKPASRLSKELSSRLKIRTEASDIDSKAFLASEPNALTGDTFRVLTEKGVITVSLQGVDLLSPSETNPAKIQAFARHFGITADQAHQVAAQSLKLLKETLEQRSFEICISPYRNEEGVFVANLFLESRQNVSQLLVSHGLAIVQPVGIDTPASGKALHEVLIEAEQSAKSTLSLRGAWQLRP